MAEDKPIWVFIISPPVKTAAKIQFATKPIIAPNKTNIIIDFVGDTSLVEAQSKAAASLEQFSENLLSYYDINFTLTCGSTENSEGFTIMGARNVAGSGLVWNNNTPVESEEES